MKNLKQKSKRILLQTVVLPFVTAICIIMILVFGVNRFYSLSQEQELNLANSALKKAVIQCYSIEGMYPASITYLKEHYGLYIDEKKYNVYYDCFSSNIMPEFGVYEK